MLWDSLSIFLVDTIYKANLEKKNLTTGILAREFNGNRLIEFKNKEEFEELLKKYRKIIRDRLKVFEREGLGIRKKNKEGNYEFELDGKKVMRYKIRFHNGRKWCIIIQEKNGKLTALQI